MENPPAFLTLAGEINQNTVCRIFSVIAGLIHDNFKDIHFLIQSTGGIIGDGVAIFNFLSNVPINFTTYNIGHVASVATIIYLAGKKRIVAETATFMIHRPYCSGIVGPVNALEAATNNLRIDEERHNSILKAILRIPSEKWAIFTDAQLFFSSKESIEYGAAHEIGLFSPKSGSPLLNIQ
jgi:ATP-dependent Clp protease protease subunit